MIDFHCHLDLFPDPHRVARECHERGIYVLSVTTTPSAWSGTNALSIEGGRILTAVGLHPQLAHERHHELDLFDKLIEETPYVGEVGLDGAPEFREHWDIQRHVFEQVLKSCARVGGRVLTIHSRRASKEVLDLYERYPRAGTPILHWYSGDKRDLDRAIELGCWFSVGPAMLKSQRGRMHAVRMPRDRVLTESDGPFAQIDGSPVFPWQVDEAVRALAELWGLSPSDAGEALHENLRRLMAGLECKKRTANLSAFGALGVGNERP